MGNCLVTTLKGTVNNGNLEKLGVLSVQLFPNGDNNNRASILVFNRTKDFVLTIQGSGYFTDSTYSQNDGQRKEIAHANSGTTIYIAGINSEGSDVLDISEKYTLGAISSNSPTIIGINDIGKKLNYMTSLETLSYGPYGGSKVTGNLEEALYNNKVFVVLRMNYGSKTEGSIENIVKRQYEMEGGVNVRTVDCQFTGSHIKLNNAYVNGNCTINIQATTTTVVKGGDTVATYTAATDSWVYA